MASEIKASAIKSPSRTSACSRTGVPKTVNSIPGFQIPDIRTAPTIPARSNRFTAPSMRNGPRVTSASIAGGSRRIKYAIENEEGDQQHGA